MLELEFLENRKKFSIYNALPDAINTYNGNIHSTTKFKTYIVFNSKDNKLIHKVLENIRKSQKKINV